MKNTRRFFVSLVALCLLVCSTFSLSACSDGVTGKPGVDIVSYMLWLAKGNVGTQEDYRDWLKYGHVHNEYHEEWSYDDTRHWHAPVCTEHEVKVKDSARHIFGGAGVCNVCGYVKYGADGIQGGVYPSYFVARRSDDRANAYSAYNKDGEKIGDFKTIAAAVNTAIDYDYDTGTFFRATESMQGSYVTALNDKNGEKYFWNRNGYTIQNNDQFWYYENGNRLNGYDRYYDNMTSILRNSRDVVIRNTGYGTQSMQYYNGYGLLGADGKLLPDTKGPAQNWELSSTMDAAVIQYTARLKGVGGLDYTLDFSQVRVTPSYDEIDTYAFMGFYVWQDYYVIVLGIACDTKTGNWFPFVATSRDDSFSDAKYNLGEKCLFTSEWHEGGGYFTPNVSEVNMSIHTVCKTVNEVATQVDEFSVKADNVVVYMLSLTDSLCAEFFPGHKLGWDNGYHFIAGLDVKNEVVYKVFTEATDYFNGAKFENLTVAKATVRFGGDELERLSSRKIQKSWKDKDFNLVMASGDHEVGVMDYTVLNTYAFTDYKAKDGKDVYSFRYEGSPVAL